MHEPKPGAVDQAAGLRRLFGVAPARLVPILVERRQPTLQVASIVRLAQACANAGERTLVIDCARAQIAATLGLRARFDLLHAVRGECRLDQARLDAGANLGVVPAARAAAQLQGASAVFLALLGALTQAAPGADLVLLIVEPAQVALLATATRGEILLPMPQQRAACAALLRSVATLSDRTDIAGFRLLFPAWDADTAARLYAELVRVCGDRLGTELLFGGAVRMAHDWRRIARTIFDWNLVRLPRPQTARMF